jgi:hypothetical protein
MMRSPICCRFLVTWLCVFLGSEGLAADSLGAADREAVLAKLKANKVSLGGLMIVPFGPVPLCYGGALLLRRIDSGLGITWAR